MEFFQTIVDQTKDSTVSKLNLGNDHFCYIIEDGFRAVKEYGKTRIAGGEYYLLPRKPQPPDDPTGGRHYQSYSKRFGHDFSLRLWKNPEGTINPDNFTFIMVHIGNFIHDTEGCLLTNSGFTRIMVPVIIAASVPPLCIKNFMKPSNLCLTKNRLSDGSYTGNADKIIRRTL